MAGALHEPEVMDAAMGMCDCQREEERELILPAQPFP